MSVSRHCQSTTPPSDMDRLRIILVGAASLDRTLRREDSVELVRAQTPLAGLGEIAHPADEPVFRTVLILGEDALPAGHREAYVAASRRLDPEVRVLAIVSDPLAGVPDAFDGLLPPAATPDDIRLALRRPTKAPEPTSTPEPEKPAAEVSAKPRHTELPDDAKLVRAILAGRDLTQSCVEQLRHRMGALNLRFIALGCESAPEGAVPVAHRGYLIGHLHDPDGVCPESQLKVSALWLAHWLALGEQQRQLREAAFTDALTGAWNRRYFERYLESTIRKAAADRRPVTILLFDVDDFKHFNDRFGHAVGDEILRSTVRLLQSCVRPSDRVCRIGGDEFAVVFFEPEGPRERGSSQPTSIFEIARRFQQRVQSEEFPVLGAQSPGPLAVSGGLATYPWDGRTPAELLATADRLLIESKVAGKNAIRYGDGVLNADSENPVH